MSESLATDAAEALQFVVRKRLTPVGWARIGETLTLLENGLAAGDEDTVRRAILDLDDVRVTRLGDQPDPAEEPVPIPPVERERINRLVDRLLPDTSDSQAGGGQGCG